jgi:hypothetical protein
VVTLPIKRTTTVVDLPRIELGSNHAVTFPLYVR